MFFLLMTKFPLLAPDITSCFLSGLPARPCFSPICLAHPLPHAHLAYYCCLIWGGGRWVGLGAEAGLYHGKLQSSWSWRGLCLVLGFFCVCVVLDVGWLFGWLGGRESCPSLCPLKTSACGEGESTLLPEKRCLHTNTSQMDVLDLLVAQQG